MVTLFMGVCELFQRYITAANHNQAWYLIKEKCSVRTISKIHYGGKSQLQTLNYMFTFQCANYFKDTLRRQITTEKAIDENSSLVCELFQRYITAANHNY